MVLLCVLLLIYQNSLRERTYLCRSALLHPHLSPWQHLLQNGDGSSFLHITGLTKRVFWHLHRILFPPPSIDPNTRMPTRRRGRPQILSSEGKLGLLLFYIGSCMSAKFLCMLFGVTPSCCSQILNEMLLLVTVTLKRHPLARVKFPDGEKMIQFAAMIQRREPLVDDVIGFMDGVSFTTQCTNEQLMKNSMYCR